MYRPQFSFPLANCETMRFHCSFDQTNTPTLASGTLAAGARTGRIPLPLDRDAAFLLRAIEQQATGLQIRLEEPYGFPLSDSENSTESQNYVYPALYSQSDGAGPVVLDSDDWGIFCPKGSLLNLYINNPTSGALNLNTVVLTLHGVKLYEGGTCQ